MHNGVCLHILLMCISLQKNYYTILLIEKDITQ